MVDILRLVCPLSPGRGSCRFKDADAKREIQTYVVSVGIVKIEIDEAPPVRMKDVLLVE